MGVGVWVLGDQLWIGQSALLRCIDRKQQTPVIAIESAQFARSRPYHRQKLVLVWSAMRHFAAELRQVGWPVTYKVAEDFETPLREWGELRSCTWHVKGIEVRTPAIAL